MHIRNKVNKHVIDNYNEYIDNTAIENTKPQSHLSIPLKENAYDKYKKKQEGFNARRRVKRSMNRMVKLDQLLQNH